MNWTVLGALAAVVVTLAACGDSGESTTAPTDTTANAQAQDAEAEATVRTAVAAIETYAVDNGGDYAGADIEQLAQIEPTLESASIDVTADATSYSLTVESASGNTFTIARDAKGEAAYTCAEPGAGDCPASGRW
jgi:hypothetical protein